MCRLRLDGSRGPRVRSRRPETCRGRQAGPRGVPLERIKAEIATCELVCANCHRRRTARRVRSWRVDPDWRSAQSTRPSRRRNLLFLLEYLRRAPCVDCGEQGPVVLGFNHVGLKRSGVVQLADRECSLAKLGTRDRRKRGSRTAIGDEQIVEQAHFRNHLVTPP